ncbi:hypothetical protein TNCT_95951 [Trichonephila clavata]|uniref:Uncharacterized protein n=1 Tax=Trichonephila clavata TaxID=2740835 RepID=A0A8X6F8I3_TRICU|nr:hypothetical protein TNCT_95951 [Trichonephila clavata]
MGLDRDKDFKFRTSEQKKRRGGTRRHFLEALLNLCRGLVDTSFVCEQQGARKKKVGSFHIFLKCINNALKEDLIRVVEELDGTVESTDTVAKLKTKIEKSSTLKVDADFVKTLIKNYVDERVSRNERQATLENQKIELAKQSTVRKRSRTSDD